VSATTIIVQAGRRELPLCAEIVFQIGFRVAKRSHQARRRLADAVTALRDERAITVRDDEGDEERYVTIGMDALGNVLVVVYTWRGKRPRLNLLVKQRRKSASSTG